MKKRDRGYLLEFPTITSRLALTWTWKKPALSHATTWLTLWFRYRWSLRQRFETFCSQSTEEVVCGEFCSNLYTWTWKVLCPLHRAGDKLWTLLTVRQRVYWWRWKEELTRCFPPSCWCILQLDPPESRQIHEWIGQSAHHIEQPAAVR